MRGKYFTLKPAQTKKLGEILGREVLKATPPKRALMIGLKGDLGGGKTTFLQGFAKGLGIKQRILSPTFVIMKKFDIKHQTSKFKRLYHIDCYRIFKPQEILNLGFNQIVFSPENIVAVEWADRIFKILPRGTIILKFEFINEKTRGITISLKNGY